MREWFVLKLDFHSNNTFITAHVNGGSNSFALVTLVMVHNKFIHLSGKTGETTSGKGLGFDVFGLLKDYLSLSRL